MIKACHLAEAFVATAALIEARNGRREGIRSAGWPMQEIPVWPSFRYGANFAMVERESGGGRGDVVAGLLDSRPAKDVTSNEAFLALHRKVHGRKTSQSRKRWNGWRLGTKHATTSRPRCGSEGKFST